jgi:hypothetical protein
MAGRAWHNFLSAAVGIGIALALARGLTYRLRPEAPRTIGSFWIDLIRVNLYVLIPFCIPVTLLLVSQGILQNFASYVEVTTLEEAKQVLAMGPVASQEFPPPSPFLWPGYRTRPKVAKRNSWQSGSSGFLSVVGWRYLGPPRCRIWCRLSWSIIRPLLSFQILVTWYHA